MYEQNREPLPMGDATVVFADHLAKIAKHASQEPAELTNKTVLRWADTSIQPHFAAIARRLLLPGSGLFGVESLKQLVDLAGQGKACLLCLNHCSNLDVPTLLALLEDHRCESLFKRMIWIAGRKLEEEAGMTRVLVQCFNRVIVTPHSWFNDSHSEERIHEARCINIAAEREIAQLRRKGWVFALFPAGTRTRLDDKSTEEAIAETDSYLKMFDYLVLGRIDGCTMPVTMGHDLTHETPKLDRVSYVFGPVQRTSQFRASAATRFEGLDQKSATAKAIIHSIMSLEAIDGRDSATVKERPDS